MDFEPFSDLKQPSPSSPLQSVRRQSEIPSSSEIERGDREPIVLHFGVGWLDGRLPCMACSRGFLPLDKDLVWFCSSESRSSKTSSASRFRQTWVKFDYWSTKLAKSSPRGVGARHKLHHTHGGGWEKRKNGKKGYQPKPTQPINRRPSVRQ